MIDALKTKTRAQLLAGEILENIAAHPELHNQSNFAVKTECGTVMCAAGWACYLNGDTFVDFKPFGLGEFSVEVLTENGVMEIADRAAGLLGLDNSQACSLFYDMDHSAVLTKLQDIADGKKIAWFF